MKFFVLLLSGILCFTIARFAPDGPLAVFLPIMISYHIFLAYLVTSFPKEAELSIGAGLFIHLLCVCILAAFVLVQDFVPYITLVRCSIPAFAFVESGLLWSTRRGQAQGKRAASILSKCTSEDYDDFVEYMRHADRRFARAGRSVNEEFALFVKSRSRGRSIFQTQNRAVE
jgi:hypothetical protein